jgi:DNA polymerase-3 subunit gamma/tau
MADRDYLVTARKYRPSLFKELVAQEHVTDTLKNALRLDRLAHAYLFSGPRGVGKTTAARILAKAINCETPREEREDGAEPCCECDSCTSFEEGRSLNVFEMDAASNNKVDDVRDLREKVRIPPQGDRKKVYILDEVHMLSKQAFNALLKTLEEPPAHALFIFATTEPHKVLPTILSRCQRFDFRRIPVPKMVDRLREICETEGVEADEESLMLLARKGNGALRDALSAFDQAISLCGKTLEYGELTQALGVVDQDLYFDLTGHVATQNTAGVLELVREVVRSGYDLQEFLVGLAEHLRNLLVARSLGGEALAEVAESTRAQYAEEAQRFGEADLLRLLTIAGDAQDEVKNSPQPRLKLETTLLKMAQMRRAADLQTVLQKIDRLEQMAEEGEIPATLAAPTDEANPPTDDSSGSSRSADSADPPSAETRQAETSNATGGTTAAASTDPSPSPQPTAAGESPPAKVSEDPAPESPDPASPTDDRVAEPSGTTADAEETTTEPDPEEETAGPTDRDEEDEEKDDPDDSSVEYNDLFGTPALDGDPSPPDEDGSSENKPNDESTDATGRRTGPDSDPDGPTAQATVAEPEARSTNGTSGVAQAWPEFVKAIRGNHIRLGLFLEEAEPVDVTDGVLIVSVSRALHRDTLRDHRRVLLDHLTDTIDETLEGVEFVVDEPTPDTDESDDESAPTSPREQLRALRDTYPALDVLFAEFEAEPIW